MAMAPFRLSPLTRVRTTGIKVFSILPVEDERLLNMIISPAAFHFDTID
jgi:hypothetical protein